MSAPVYPATGRTWTAVRVSAVMVTNRPFSAGGTRNTGDGGTVFFRRNPSPYCGDFPISEMPFTFTFRVNPRRRDLAVSILQLRKIINLGEMCSGIPGDLRPIVARHRRTR